MSTISAVLYANQNHPELKTEYPHWPDRYKQIMKKWRALTTEKKQPYLQRARDNRSAQQAQLRTKKAQQVRVKKIIIKFYFFYTYFDTHKRFYFVLFKKYTYTLISSYLYFFTFVQCIVLINKLKLILGFIILFIFHQLQKKVQIIVLIMCFLFIKICFNHHQIHPFYIFSAPSYIICILPKE